MGLLTTGELAAELGLTPGHVRRLARRGVIRARRVTERGHRRFDLQALYGDGLTADEVIAKWKAIRRGSGTD